jgi:hypothetical protein
MRAGLAASYRFRKAEHNDKLGPRFMSQLQQSYSDLDLLDFFQVALDLQHRANLIFADDHLASPLCTTQSPGHCANNDPASFRVATPFFTYQLKANPSVVTTGKCAGS